MGAAPGGRGRGIRGGGRVCVDWGHGGRVGDERGAGGGALLENASIWRARSSGGNLLGAVRELTELRRTNLALAKERREQADWERERAEAEEKKRVDAESWARLAPLRRQMCPELFDEDGEPRDWRNQSILPAGLRECLKLNEDLKKEAGLNGTNDVKGGVIPPAKRNGEGAGNQTNSGQIKPNQGNGEGGSGANP